MIKHNFILNFFEICILNIWTGFELVVIKVGQVNEFFVNSLS